MKKIYDIVDRLIFTSQDVFVCIFLGTYPLKCLKTLTVINETQCVNTYI